jgi:hypothetical protein
MRNVSFQPAMSPCPVICDRWYGSQISFRSSFAAPSAKREKTALLHVESHGKPLRQEERERTRARKTSFNQLSKVPWAQRVGQICPHQAVQARSHRRHAGTMPPELHAYRWPSDRPGGTAGRASPTRGRASTSHCAGRAMPLSCSCPNRAAVMICLTTQTNHLPKLCCS